MKWKIAWNSLQQTMTAELNDRNKKYLLAYFVLISFLEILAYSKGYIFSLVASRIWFLTAIIIFVVFCGFVFKTLYTDVKNKNYFLVVGFLGSMIFLLFFVGNVGYGDINADAAQQLSAGLSSFSASDWNYTGLAFLGYANRQYILGALPALLFGRSIFTLHLGFAGLFIIGLAMLFFEFRSWLKKYEVNETLALVPCYSIMAFRFIAEYYLNFEQAITPVALTMIGIALFIRLCRKIDVFTVIALTWVGCFYCDSYTPAIASLGLLLCFLLLYALDIYLKNVKTRSFEKHSNDCRNFSAKIQVLVGSAVTMICFFAATLLGKREDRLISVREEVDLVSLATESWWDFFSDKNAVFFGIFLGAVLLYVFLAMTFCLKFYDFVIAVWVFGVVLFANLLEGYTSYEKSWILQRNMIIIPVLVTVIFICIIRFLVKYKIHIDCKCRMAILLFLGLIGISNFRKEHQSFNYFRYIQPMKYMIACAEEVLEENEISNESEINIILITDNLLQSNLYDYAKFFYPNAYAYSMTSNGNIPDIDWSRRTLVFAESEESLLRFDIDVKSETYDNVRYKTEVTWYYGEIKQDKSDCIIIG